MLTILELVQYLGIPGNYIGRRYLITAVELVLDNEDSLLRVTKLLYPQVALAHDTTMMRVEKNLRTVIKLCWDRNGRERLERLAGYPLESKPDTAEFIDILSSFIKRNGTLSDEEIATLRGTNVFQF